MNAWKEKLMQGVFFIAACTSVLAVALICVFLFINGVPAMKEIGFVKFLTGTVWRPNNDIYGIFPMIMGQFIGILGGSLIVENFFSIPGVGQMYIKSINVRDYNFFMFLSMFYE